MTRTIRLVAIDLDGTLFNTQQQVSRGSCVALGRALEAGIQPIIVTGRGRPNVVSLLESIDLDLPYICSAGSLVCSGRNGRVISARTFHSKPEMDRVIAFVREKDTGLVADGLEQDMWFGPDHLITDLDPFTASSTRLGFRTFEPEKDFDRPFLKVSIVGSRGLLARAEEEVLVHCPSFHHIFAGLSYVDITARGVDKGSALEIYGNNRGTPLAEIAAIGDQPNDQSMLGLAGLSIAMGNAPENVKTSAEWIAPTNDEDGVAWALDKILEMQ